MVKSTGWIHFAMHRSILCSLDHEFLKLPVLLIYIDVGAGPAGPVLAGPLFGDVIIDILKNCVCPSCAPITARPCTSKVLSTPLLCD